MHVGQGLHAAEGENHSCGCRAGNEPTPRSLSALEGLFSYVPVFKTSFQNDTFSNVTLQSHLGA